MSSRSSRTQVCRPAGVRAATLGLALLTTTGLLAACSDDGGTQNTSEEPTAASSTPTPTESETPSESPTPSPSTTSPTPTPEPTPTQTVTPAPDLTSKLLPARAVAGLNQEWRWRAGETRTAEPATEQLPECLRFSLAAIGASEAVTRSYLPPRFAADAPASALQVVAGFPDQETASRVMQVLRSWHGTCERRLNKVSDQKHRISDAVSVGRGLDAFTYLHTTRGSTPDTTAFEDVSQVRVGDRISIVVVRLDEQDYNYDQDDTPAARSAVAAARRLG